MAYSYGPIIVAATSKPIAVSYDATISSTTPITLNAATTAIEVTAVDKSIFLKWDASATTSAWDGVIAANTTKVFTVPRGTVTANFIEQASAAILMVAEF